MQRFALDSFNCFPNFVYCFCVIFESDAVLSNIYTGFALCQVEALVISYKKAVIPLEAEILIQGLKVHVLWNRIYPKIGYAIGACFQNPNAISFSLTSIALVFNCCFFGVL